MSTEIVPTAQDLAEIVGQVWSSYLDTEGTEPLVPIDQSPKTDIVASVSITGGWSGHVVVSCSDTAARHAAGAFLLMDASEVSDDDVTDVLGELANIVGGNVKSMLPASSMVSLPQVVHASGGSVRWPACVQICELAGEWRNEPVSIAMWQKTDLSDGNG
jgi:chemotaxis protein CheX